MADSSLRPYTLVAELTYACPLRCTYCSNPPERSRPRELLDTSTWCRVLGEAEALGVVQVNLTGGEPLVRRDLEQVVAHAKGLDLYVNLITSGVPLDRERLGELARAGLASVQLSFQDVDVASAQRIAGVDCLQQKLLVARWAAELELPLTVNFVLHRGNLDRTAELIHLAEELGAERIELANTQYLGVALANQEKLLPSREQIDRARQDASRERERLRGRCEVLFVLPDYFSDRPRPCMDGWARRYVVVTPNGLVLPCHAAASLPLQFENVRDQPLSTIWLSSNALNAYRGEHWMTEPCRSCERRFIDFGGCRCQAYALTGNAASTDPACALSPRHAEVERRVARLADHENRVHLPRAPQS